ncbi:MAG: 1,4-beta-xylanase, partial [Anaerolineae bacterium]|nr:1,4-beta-xylanase [Anaerolineae bacterium]
MSIDIEQLRALRWPLSRAAEYAERCAALRGCNYIPRHCINPTQMWQELNEREIDQELGWAAGIGLNSLRVFLQYIVYEAGPGALLDRMAAFLDIAARHGLSTMFVLLDDCWAPEPALGAQPAPVPGVHNSGWTQSP